MSYTNNAVAYGLQANGHHPSMFNRQAGPVPASSQQPQSSRPMMATVSGSDSAPPGEQQRNNFYATLHEIHRRNRTTLQESYQLEGRTIDLFRLYGTALGFGGSKQLSATGTWDRLLDKMGFERDQTGNHPEPRKQAIAAIHAHSVGQLEQLTLHHVAQRKGMSRPPQQQQQQAMLSTPTASGTPAAPSPAPTSTPVEDNAGRVKQELREPSVVGDESQSKARADDSSAPQDRHRRKRQRIEYVPVNRKMDTTVGSWDLGLWDELIPAVAKRRHQRDLTDLGLIDVHSLTMSLRSRMDTEVAYAMNVLTLLSINSAIPGDPRNFVFTFTMAPDLLEEAIDLLEETAFGKISDPTASPRSTTTTASNKAPSRPFRTYDDLYRLATEEEGELRDFEREPLSAERPIRPSALVLALTNFFRNMNLYPDSIVMCARMPRFVELLFRLAHLRLRRDEQPTTSRGDDAIVVSARELLAIRKDVMHIISMFGLIKDTQVQLAALPLDVQDMAFELLMSFLVPCNLWADPYFDLSHCTNTVAQLPLSHRQAPYLELGLLVFARVAVHDSNRSVLGSLKPPVDLYELFESMSLNLPVNEEGFVRLTSEDGFLAIEHLTMSMYNILSFAPTSFKARLRERPSFIKALVRIVKRLYTPPPATPMEAEQNVFAPLCERCIEMLQLIDDTGSALVSAQSDLPWYGLSMHAQDDLDQFDDDDGGNDGRGDAHERPPPKWIAPGPGSVKAQGPPRGRRTGPPVLLSETDGVFDLLKAGSPLFLKLEAMLGIKKE